MLGSVSKDVFERRTPTGTICSKVQKAHFRLTCVAPKRLCLSSLLVFQNNKTAALLVFQTSPVGVESREWKRSTDHLRLFSTQFSPSGVVNPGNYLFQSPSYGRACVCIVYERQKANSLKSTFGGLNLKKKINIQVEND